MRFLYHRKVRKEVTAKLSISIYIKFLFVFLNAVNMKIASFIRYILITLAYLQDSVPKSS